MAAFVITRAGKGSVFSFKNVLSADTHPITQFGDPIMSKVEHLWQCLSLPELAMVAEKIGDTGLGAQLKRFADHPKEHVRGLLDSLWERLNKMAPTPPTDPAEVMKIVMADRIATRSTGIHIRPRGEFEMSKHHHQEETAVAEAAVENAEVVNENATENATEATTEKKGRPIPKDPKYAGSSVISLLADKEGNQYGPENNPKKAGSASAERFSRYVDGMTVEEARAAGLQNGDLDNDVKKEYISIV